MEKHSMKFIKPIATLALGATVLTAAVLGTPANVAEAASYKVSKGYLISKTTGKKISGYKTYNGKVYKDGKLLNGLKSGVYYKQGKKASGTYKGKYYSKGKKYTGLKSGNYYKDGVKASGTYKSKYYSKGKLYSGLKSGVYYKNGVKGTGSYKSKYYSKGNLLTGIRTSTGSLYVKGELNKGLKLYKEELYNGSKLNKGLALYAGKLYNGSKLNKGVVEFNEKWYNGSTLANGLIKTPDGKTINVKDGIQILNAVEKATNAVEKAETSKTIAEVAVAQNLLTALEDGEVKTALQTRLDAIDLAEKVATVEELTTALANDQVKSITLTADITTTTPVAPKAGVTIDGAGNKIAINTLSPEGNNTADGLYIQQDNVTLKNITVTGTHTDNLIEIYSDNATLENVTVSGGKKAGIYVNNDGVKTLTVNFNGVHTTDNGWNAGIGLAAQKADSKVIANFSGNNTFGEDVAVYSEKGTKYAGTYEVNGLENFVKTEIASQDKWIYETKAFVSNEEELSKALANEKVKTIKLTANITSTTPVAPKAGVTIDGAGNELAVHTVSPGGNNTADGVFIQEKDVTLKNITITGTHNDNLVEIYGDNATLDNVTVTGSKKAGIYVNHNGVGDITVNFKDVHTDTNIWAGIGLIAQKEEATIIANFSGENKLDEEVALYTDDKMLYLGDYKVNGLKGYEVKRVGQQYHWKKTK
ncbi:pectate lyase-like adhesive domain-containing protein [Viridibacillus sp. FSL E2-0187]|uniref:pectate lyase-like adhesive domain-containing protein n=1 Tax=Viridibacillus sp. FSL E2-0187 TaxID=2921362 RepID=UPI0030FA757F